MTTKISCSEYIKKLFPTIDEHLKQYVEGVLANSAEEFEDSEEIFEAIGAVLQEIATEKTEQDIRNICNELMNLLRPENREKIDSLSEKSTTTNGNLKILNLPVHMATMADQQNDVMKQDDVRSIWVTQRDDTLKVNAKKLEKAEQKLIEKKRTKDQQFNQAKLSSAVNHSTNVNNKDAAALASRSATATQVLNKKDTKMEAKGANRAQDIRIENFDIAYGDRVLLQGANLTLAFGRRYGLVGRNGLGKSTLLKMISTANLKIPAHISILHVEQEVTGDETIAIDSVLECDVTRKTLIDREMTIAQKMAAKEENGAHSGNGEDDAQYSSELSEIYAQLQHIEADKAPARASVILAGLGFTTQMQRSATRTFSGGWRMRLALARALFSRPDLLLLDEPTNMLDIKAIIWLENYLQTWPTTLLVVSHDRNFLDTVPSDILHLHSQRIDSYRGNYEQFAKTKEEKLKNQQREYDAQLQQRQHVQEFIDRFRYNANRAALVQSKIKMLERMPELKALQKEPEVVLRLPDTEPLSPPILQLNDVTFEYVKNAPIFTHVNLGATMESRICIVGDNGAGKTTLLKIIMGLLTPSRGSRHVHRNLKFGYFSQHHVDQLDMTVNSVELLQKEYSGKPIEEYRRQLGSFGITGDLALQTVNSLSGGQKSRVAFALMGMRRPNFLVLDEPTNHLDIETIEALGKAIKKYTGGVILVSHDERLIRMVTTELWHCGDGTVKSVEGGFDEYRKIVERELEMANAPGK